MPQPMTEAQMIDTAEFVAIARSQRRAKKLGRDLSADELADDFNAALATVKNDELRQAEARRRRAANARLAAQILGA